MSTRTIVVKIASKMGKNEKIRIKLTVAKKRSMKHFYKSFFVKVPFDYRS